MKFTIDAKEFAKALGTIKGLLPKNGTSMPILDCVEIETMGGSIRLFKTDLESSAVVSVIADVKETGRVAVPLEMLLKAIRKPKSGDVKITTTKSSIKISIGARSYALSMMDPEDMPNKPEKGKHLLSIGYSELRKPLDDVLRALPVRDPRRVLTGVLLETGGIKLQLTATDGLKLCHAEILSNGEDDFRGVIPGHALTKLSRLLKRDMDVKVSIIETKPAPCRTAPVVQFGVESLGLTYSIESIDEKYPDYDAVIPKKFDRVVELPVDALFEAISRASEFAEEKHHSIIFEFAKRSVTLKAQTFDEGSYREKVKIDYAGDPFKIALNYSCALTVLGAIDDETVTMKTEGGRSPIIFTGESNPNTLHLIMPVRIHDLEKD